MGGVVKQVISLAEAIGRKSAGASHPTFPEQSWGHSNVTFHTWDRNGCVWGTQFRVKLKAAPAETRWRNLCSFPMCS